MTKHAIRRLLVHIPLFLLGVILMAGCASGESKASEPITSEDSQAIVEQSAAPSDVETVEPAPNTGMVTEVEDNKTPATVQSAEPTTASDQPAKVLPVPSETPVSKGTKEDVPSASPSTAATVKTPATMKPSAGKTASPSPSPSPTSKPAASPSSAPPASNEKENTVTLSITGNKASGVILEPTVIEVQKGDSVMDLLKKITRKHKIQMEFKGVGTFSYVEGISNLYEHDDGAESGWMYRVNGVFPDEGAGSYKVYPGDRIEWLYTQDLGRDIGAKMP